MDGKGEVAFKIIRGDKLSLKEFAIAIKNELINSNAKTDEEIAKTFVSWSKTWYKGAKRHGYLCTSYPSANIDDDHMCAWGIHLDEVDPNFLTEDNLVVLRHSFGDEKVKEVTGR